MRGVIWLNGSLMAQKAARIEPADRGFLLGDGLFETILARDGRCVLLTEHLDRLRAGARDLEIPLPFELPEIAEAIKAVLEANALEGRSQAVRVTLSRGVGTRGLLPPSEPSPTLLVSSVAYHRPIASNGASATIETRFRRNEGSALTRLKSLGCLDNIMALNVASRAGFDEAILLNNAGAIACASRANIFAAIGDRLLTPPISDGALAGVTRRFTIDLASSLGHEVCEARILPDMIAEASEAFITNSLIGVVALRRIDEATFDEGPLSRAIAEAYRGLSE